MTVRDAAASATGTHCSIAGLRPQQLSLFACAAVLAVSFWNVFVNGGTHMDVSWLLTVGEKMLTGEKLYVDIWETNPPFSAFLYLPMAWLGTVTPVAAETWTKIATYLWAIGFGWIALSMSGRLGLTTARERLALLPVGLYVLILFVPFAFSQREHFGLASALPILVLAARRMSGGNTRGLGFAWIAAAGLGAAVTMMVKPHYALAFLFPYLLAAWSARSIRVLVGPEVLVAAVVTVVYGTVLWVFYPEYLTRMVPLLLDVYRVRRSLVILIFASDWMQLVLGALLFLLMAVTAARRENPLVWTFAAAALGFYIAFLVMGKGWIYHSMPALSLTALAIAIAGARWALRERDSNGALRRNDVIFLALVAAASMMISHTSLFWSRFDPPKGLIARVRTVAPHPVVASVSHDIGIGHPFKRSLHGTWIERTCSDWIVALGSSELLSDPGMEEAKRERIEGRIDDAIAHKIDTWTATPPDVVLLDPETTGEVKRITEDPEFAQILSNYKVVYEDKWLKLALRSDLVPAYRAVTARASSPGAGSD